MQFIILSFTMVHIFACSTIHLGEVVEVKIPPLRISCAETNDFESNAKIVVTCAFENRSNDTQEAVVTSVRVESGGDVFVPLSADESRAVVDEYLSTSLAHGRSSVAIGVVTGVGVARESGARGGVAVAGMGAYGLSEANQKNRVDFLKRGFESSQLFMGPLNIDGRSHQLRRGIFAYGWQRRGARTMVICWNNNDESCVKVPLNPTTSLRQRG